MSTREDGPASPPIESRDELVAYLEAGCKPPADWRIGTEHEKFGFRTDDLKPLTYEGPRGVRAVLNEMVDRFGWAPIMEGDNVIALKQPNCPLGGNVSLEPGGQLELSGAPLSTVHETCKEVNGHLVQVQEIGQDLGIGFLGLGFSPKWTLAETPTMPKGRYAIMKRYMPEVGGLGLDMMHRSCTIQVNLDFASEADMVKKFRVSLALQPIATALFANSPFKECGLNGYISYRSELWRDTDPHRTGMLPFVFDEGMGFERYVDYVLDVPMYFVYRKGHYVDVAGKSFRDFLNGRLEALPGERPDITDWSDHLSTAFPEVRLKRFLEMRGADGGPWKRVCALPSFWVGVLYDATALDACWDLVKGWTADERQDLRDVVPRLGLDAEIGGRSVRDIAADVLQIAKSGLAARDRRDGLGVDEGQYLISLEQVIERGKTSAGDLIERFRGPWQGDIDHVFQEGAF